MHAKDCIQTIESKVPPSLALSFDHSGLQAGPYSREIEHILVTLDVTEPVVDHAISSGYPMILCHHPILFHPLYAIDTDHYVGRIISRLVQHQITLYAIHTPIDIITGGINDLFAQELGLQDTRIIQPIEDGAIYKFQVGVPVAYRNHIIEAISRAGAGWIGNYAECTFSSQGVGTFLPGDSAQPFIGSSGKREEVEEVKIETVVPAQKIPKLLEEIRSAHPYEEIAYDLFPLTYPKMPPSKGIGRIGRFGKPFSLEQVVIHVRQAFPKARHVRMYGSNDRMLQTVAVCNGSGSIIIDQLPEETELFITADLGYHQIQHLLQKGVQVILMEHDDSEQLFFRALQTLVPEIAGILKSV